MLSRHDRRSFIRQSAAIGVAIAMPGIRAWAATKSLGPNDQIGVGMIGAGGRAEELLNDIVKISGMRLD